MKWLIMKGTYFRTHMTHMKNHFALKIKLILGLLWFFAIVNHYLYDDQAHFLPN